VVITVVTVRVMQVPIDQIVHVVTMRNWFVATTRTVHMARIMLGAVMIGRALGWIS
jgi:hypothetical protein